MMKQTIIPIWTLLFGVAIITMASGLQGSLLGIRASIEEFNTTATGFVMSGYYIGFIIGSFLIPIWVKNVGHIRVFAAVASLASITILMQSAIVNPWFWLFMRIGTGLCYAGLFIVAESWLNDISTNSTRGSLLSIYMVVLWGGYALGQMLLNISSPDGYDLFILASVLISLALVPLLLVRTSSPTIDIPEKLALIGLIKTAPLGVTGVTLAGVTGGAVLGLSAVYAQSIGMSVGEISFFLGASYIGGLLLQWPIGLLSDHQDRRVTILLISLLACVTALIVPIGLNENSQSIMLFGMFLIGAFSFPLYSLSASHINDQLRHEQILSASSGMILLNGLGGALGPIIASIAMDWIHINALYVFVSGINLLVACMAAYRIYHQPPMVIEDQGGQMPVAMSVTPVVAAEMFVEADASNEDEPVEIKL